MIRRNSYSLAWRGFERSLKRAAQLREMEVRRYKDPPPPRQIIPVEALRGGAVVLMVAAFERYLKDAFEEYAGAIAAKAKSTTHAGLESRFVECNDYNFVSWLVRENRGSRLDKLAELKRVAKLIAGDGFIPESFSRTRANPGPETLKELFADFGVKDPFRVLEGNLVRYYPKPYAAGFARQQLASIVVRRHDVAHGGNALSIARTDLEEWLIFMNALARSVDNTLRDHTLAIIAAL